MINISEILPLRRFASPKDLRIALRTDDELREQVVEHLVNHENYDRSRALPFVDRIAKADPAAVLDPEMDEWIVQYWKLLETASDLKSRERRVFERQRDIDNAMRVAEQARAALKVEQAKIGLMDEYIESITHFYLAQYSGIPVGNHQNPVEVISPMKNLVAAERGKEFIATRIIPLIEDAIRSAEATLQTIRPKKRASA